MKTWLAGWAAVLFAVPALAAGPVIWNGQYAKVLSPRGIALAGNSGSTKRIVDLNVDPLVIGFAANIGSIGLYNREGAGELYVKSGSGDTDWEILLTTGGVGGAVDLPGLADVSDSLVYTNGQVLKANGSQYTNGQVAFSELSGNATIAQGGTGLTSIVTDGTYLKSSGGAYTGVTPVELTGDQTIAGVKTFSSLPVSSATPTTSNQFVTKTYADSLAAGFSFKEAVKVATTASLAATYANGASGVGATLTANSNGIISTVDGYSFAVLNERLLVKDQSSGAHNGCYTLTDPGTASTPYVLTRCEDYDTSAELNQGTAFLALNGTTQMASQWAQSTESAPTVGTTPLSYIQISAPVTYTASSGVALSGTDFSLDLFSGGAIQLSGNEALVGVDGSTIERNADALRVKDAGITAAKLAAASVDLAGNATTGILPATRGGTSTATVTAGDLLYGSGANAWGKLGIGSAGQVLGISGGVPAWQSVSSAGTATINYVKTLETDTTAVTISNSATETVVYDYTFSAAELSTDKAIRLTLLGSYVQDSNQSRTVTVRVKLGGTTILAETSSNITDANTTPGYWGGVVWLQNTGTDSEQHANMHFRFENGADTNLAELRDQEGATVDTSGSVTLEVTVQLSAGNATQTFVREGAILEMMNASDTIGAPTSASYVTLGTNSGLSDERVLTGTANQITVTDGGAGGNVTLSTPQDIGTASSPQFTGVNVGHASDTTIARSSAGVITVEGVVVPTATSTTKLSNKIYTPAVVSTTYAASPTIASDTTGLYIQTAVTGNITFNAPSGTCSQGQRLEIWLKRSSGTVTLTWNAIFRAGTTVPQVTSIADTTWHKWLYECNTTDTKWDLHAYATGF